MVKRSLIFTSVSRHADSSPADWSLKMNVGDGAMVDGEGTFSPIQHPGRSPTPGALAAPRPRERQFAAFVPARWYIETSAKSE
jgi:hypothetical protein